MANSPTIDISYHLSYIIMMTISKKVKSININIRLQQTTLILLKKKAVKLGFPYQTLAASILHRYVTGHIIISNT